MWLFRENNQTTHDSANDERIQNFKERWNYTTICSRMNGFIIWAFCVWVCVWEQTVYLQTNPREDHWSTARWRPALHATVRDFIQLLCSEGLWETETSAAVICGKQQERSVINPTAQTRPASHTHIHTRADRQWLLRHSL